MRQEQLVVSAEAKFDETTGKAPVRQFGQRLGMRAFAVFFEALEKGEKVRDLKVIYENIKFKYLDLPKPGTKDAMKLALRNYESQRQDECELIS